MYIRVKRQKTTVFLQVEPTDTVLEVKQKLQALLDKVRLHNLLACAPLSTSDSTEKQHYSCCFCSSICRAVAWCWYVLLFVSNALTYNHLQHHEQQDF
jgi:hypothetical protein